MSSDVAIKVENLSKCYQIYSQPHDRLKQSIYPRLQRIFNQNPKQYFREFWALKNLTFDIFKGETVGIIGTNGSGKSTLLQIICGTLNSTSGNIHVNGRIAALLELGAGFNPEFTGRENVYMNAAVLGLSKKEIDNCLNDILVFADIGEFIDQPVKTYSSGMAVRLAFSVAINVEPQILIVDEALSVGDEIFQRKCFSRIEAIKKKGATVLFVSHSASTIVELCDRAILIDNGEKLISGSPKMVVGKYQKLLYSPVDKRKSIRSEILKGEVISPHKKRSALKLKENKVENELAEFFDPHLKPQSVIDYESLGAHIESPDIYTISGEKVNHLKRGEIYRFVYRVKITQQVKNVRVGMLIKSTTGIELGGAISEAEQGIELLSVGTILKVEFKFACNLNPGTYFINAGVTGRTIDGGDETFLHRVLDFCMFKVNPIFQNTVTAIVDFQCVSEIEYIKKTVESA